MALTRVIGDIALVGYATRRFLALGGHRTRVAFGVGALVFVVTLTALIAWDEPNRGILLTHSSYGSQPTTAP